MSRRAVPAVAAALVAALLALLAGCGLDVMAQPAPVTVPTTASPPPSGAPDARGHVPVYLVRDGVLVAVLRRGDSTADALAALVAGPTPVETASGLATALGTGPITLPPERQRPGTAVLAVSEEFAALSGASQLLAMGQVVFTATGVCCASRVEVLLNGRQLSLPTDDGLVTRAVTRDDYASIAPR